MSLADIDRILTRGCNRRMAGGGRIPKPSHPWRSVGTSDLYRLLGKLRKMSTTPDRPLHAPMELHRDTET